ncbi:hypothetical protein BRC89_06115 [Halobacteriales archaeon QS_4_70_19]|nr:MAG: hypothetical protein BRC89_06115 [Halobacteriales archaeon QS_4_70_19]
MTLLVPVLPLQIPGGVELLLLLLAVVVLGVVLPIALGYYVYADAERRGEDNATLWAIAVGGLTAVGFVVGIVVFVVYILQREDESGRPA